MTTSVNSPVAKPSSLPSYYGYFDGLRAVLALSVFVAHADLLPSRYQLVGGLSVRIFFALSGFLVGGILLDKANGPDFWQNVPRFYFNRCLRIWVPYYLMLTSFVVLIALRGLWDDDISRRLFPLLTYTHNWTNRLWGLGTTVTPINHAESLSVEEQFYLVCPILVGLVRNRLLIIALMLLLGVGLPTGTFFSGICLGVAAAAVQRTVVPSVWLVVQRASLVAGLSTMLYILATNLNLDRPVVEVGSVLLVVGLSFESPQRPTIHLLGAMSYSFYLFHWLGLYLANPVAKLCPNSIADYVRPSLGFLFAAIVSFVSVRLIEWPILARRNSLVARMPRAPVFATILASSVTLSGLVYVLSR
jgi:peptidoglycan/LPS O-acetylase OafA/YrhL